MSSSGSKKQKILLYGSTILFSVVILFSGFAFYKSGTIPVVFTSDVHSHVDDYIGYPRLYTVVKKIKNSNTNKSPILVDVGDTFSGSTEVAQTEGKYVEDILNALPYSVMTLGNHDFDYGVKGIKKIAKNLNFPIVTTNILNEEDQTSLFNSYWVIPYKTNLFRIKKVGFVSFLTPSTKRKNLKSKTESVYFSIDMDRLQKTINNLRKIADVVIMLSHTDSLTYSSPKITVQEDIDGSIENILKSVTGIDAVIAGHTHTTPELGIKIEGVPVFHVGEYMKYVGILKITEKMFSSSYDMTVEYVDQSNMSRYEKDVKISDLISNLQKDFQDKYYKQIAYSNIDLSYNKRLQGLQQVKLGSYITDALKEETEADVVLLNAGGIRAPIKKGSLTLNDVVLILPFGNTAELVRLTGKELKEVMEISNSLYPESSPSYIQYSSNMKVDVDKNQLVGKRVKSISINSRTIKDTDMFKVLINNYMLEGNDGYDFFKTKEAIKSFGLMDELLKNYIVNHSPINY